jgi:hypothetical protein
MSVKQLARLAAILGVLLLVWGAAALAKRRENAPPSGSVFQLPPIASSAVDTVRLRHGIDTTLLARKDSSTWTVNGRPAATKAVTELLSALADSTGKSELVAERRPSHAGFGVDSAGGTRVEVKTANRTLADLVVGRRSEDYSGGYVRHADQEPTYMVRGRLVELATRPAEEWRDHRIARVVPDSVARVEISRGARRYALSRQDQNWVFSPGGRADSARVADLMSAYQTMEASGFASPAEAKSARFSSPDRRVRLVRQDGTPLVTLLFDSTATGFWVRPDTGKTVYKVESWTADQLVPADTSLRTKGK